MITTADDGPRDAAQAGPGFSDAVTFAFGDPRADVYAIARLGLAGGTGSGLAIVFSGGAPVAVSAEGSVTVDGPGWEAVAAADLSTTTDEPLQAWQIAFDGDGASFDLRFEACSSPASLDPDHAAARLGGMRGYEQLCRVSGEARIDGRRTAIDCLGQRGHTWGEPDWESITVARTVTAWLEDERAVGVSAVRPAGAEHHLDEALAAFVVDGDAPLWVADPRLSTGYDGEGHQRRAGLELWPSEDSDRPYRLAGEVLCGTTLDLGRLRLHCAFFHWHMDGRTGVGRYDVLRRVDEPAG